MRWLALALGAVAACGSVSTPIDAAGPDADLLGSLRAGCVLMAHMDETVWTNAPGEVRDDCGGDNNGTAIGGITTTDDAIRGRSGLFDGNGYIEVPTASALDASTAITISAWFKATALDDQTAFGIVSKRTDTGIDQAYSVYLWTRNKLWVDFPDQNQRFEGSAVISNNVWTQVTAVYDGTNASPNMRVTVYLNGVVDSTQSDTVTSLPTSPAKLTIGAMPSSLAVQNFKGVLDEVVVWTRPLSQAEVTQWYESTKP
jgi:hypothetical protein